MKYEEMMQRLTEIADQLEQGKLSLEESAKLYAEGMELSTQCHTLLQAAVLSVEEIPVPLQGNEE